MNRNWVVTCPVRTFAETDYRFGTGPLKMAIEHVDWLAPMHYDGENWYEVYGVEQTLDGREVCRRQALVRGSRLSSLLDDPSVPVAAPQVARPPIDSPPIRA
jgi:hypothetical protein